MKSNKFIFGIYQHVNDEGLFFTKVFFGYKDRWESTKTVEESLIFVEDDEKEVKELSDLFTDCDLCGFPDDFIFFSYEIISEDKLVDKSKVIESLGKLGFEYNQEFEEAAIEWETTNPDDGEDLSRPPFMDETIEEKYYQAVEAAIRYQEREKEKSGKEYSYNQPIQGETLIPLLSEEEKFELGGNPDFFVYPWEGDLYVVVSGNDVPSRSFGEDFLRELIRLILKENSECQ